MSEKISIIIPVYNEEDNLNELYKRLKTVIVENFAELEYEIIFVDDGSTDRSFEVIKSLHEKDRNVFGIQFSRNFGHHIAIMAGIQNASGNFTVLMDGDLQDKPEEIPKLYNKLKEGFNLVIGIRDKRKDIFIKKFFSKCFFEVMKMLADINIPENQTMLRIFDDKVLKELKKIKESHIFLAGLFAWIGFKQGTCLVTHDKRMNGKSKYNFVKSMILATDAILSFSSKPLSYISISGLIISVLAVVYGIFIILMKLIYGFGLTGWPSIIAVTTFIGGITLFSIGVLGLYIGRLYRQSLNRPLYICNEKTDE